MFWTTLGVGTLINTAGIFVSISGKQGMRSLSGTLNRYAAENYVPEEAPDVDYDLSASNDTYEFPWFPEESCDKLCDMQMQHAEKRIERYDALKERLMSMKEDFFAEHHYDSSPNSRGGLDIVTDENGDPVILPGGEDPQQQFFREQFDKVRHENLLVDQDARKEEFLLPEKEKFLEYLKENKDNLDSDEVRQELTEITSDFMKRTFAAWQDFEDELWMIMLPDDEKLREAAAEGLRELHALELEQAALEENSPDMQAVINYECAMAACMNARRAAERVDKNEFEMILDPRKALYKEEGPLDLGEVLPGYLSGILSGLDITEI